MNGHSTLSRFPRAQRGFTLIELSIVLVIIGLLIGGILVGQSLIGSAKLSSTVSQIQQFDAGVMAFKAQYNYLPGDAPAFGGTANGDGYIGSYGNPPGTTHIFSGEIAGFWNAWNPTQYSRPPSADSGDVVGDRVIVSGTNKNVPISKLGKPNSFFLASAISQASYPVVIDPNDRRNFYAILDGGSEAQVLNGCCYMFQTTGISNSAVTPTDTFALDVKMDDGIANTGNVLSGSLGNNGGNGGIILTPATGICSSGATYLVNDTGFECTPLIRIGGSTGDPQ